MATAEILAVGTELLLGATQDTNTRHLAERLRQLGVNVYRATVVGDNRARIAAAVTEALARADILIITGGLGPTKDDVTREAVADALALPLEFRPALWEAVEAAFKRVGRVPEASNRRQAFVPQGASALSNPVGTAPGFLLWDAGRLIASLPGVPSEMVRMFEDGVTAALAERFPAEQVLVSRTLHVAGLGESTIDAHLAELLAAANPTVGLAAHFGVVDVRITASDATPQGAAARLSPVETEVRRRLGPAVFGADGDTLADVVLARLAVGGLTLATFESGGVGLASVLAETRTARTTFLGGDVVAHCDRIGAEELTRRTANTQARHGASVAVGVAVDPPSRIGVVVLAPGGPSTEAINFGGAPEVIGRRARNAALAALRLRLIPGR